MPTTYTTLQYDQGAKLRATSEQPQWYSVTFQLADGGALADSDVIKFAKLGANQKVLQYSLGCDASFASSCADDGVITVGSTDIDTSVEGDTIAVADRTNLESVAVAHVSADDDDLKFTVGNLTAASTSGVRKLTLSVQLQQQNSASAARYSTIDYSSSYPL